MTSSINEKLDKLRLIIQNRKNKEIVIDILNKALNIKLTDFKYQGIKALQKISEYDFSVLKIVGKVKNKEYEFYIKTVSILTIFYYFGDTMSQIVFWAIDIFIHIF